jgi:hypothetical protein
MNVLLVQVQNIWTAAKKTYSVPKYDLAEQDGLTETLFLTLVSHVGMGYSENHHICLACAVLCFLRLAHPLQKITEDGFVISSTGCSGSKPTIQPWIRKLLKDFEISASAGSLLSPSSSAAFLLGGSTDAIMESRSWKQENTYGNMAEALSPLDV